LQYGLAISAFDETNLLVVNNGIEETDFVGAWICEEIFGSQQRA
jgi:hypothetical protein